jgi:hypothetical protein
MSRADMDPRAFVDDLPEGTVQTQLEQDPILCSLTQREALREWLDRAFEAFHRTPSSPVPDENPTMENILREQFASQQFAGRPMAHYIFTHTNPSTLDEPHEEFSDTRGVGQVFDADGLYVGDDKTTKRFNFHLRQLIEGTLGMAAWNVMNNMGTETRSFGPPVVTTCDEDTQELEKEEIKKYHSQELVGTPNQARVARKFADVRKVAGGPIE